MTILGTGHILDTVTILCTCTDMFCFTTVVSVAVDVGVHMCTYMYMHTFTFIFEYYTQFDVRMCTRVGMCIISTFGVIVVNAHLCREAA